MLCCVRQLLSDSASASLRLWPLSPMHPGLAELAELLQPPPSLHPHAHDTPQRRLRSADEQGQERVEWDRAAPPLSGESSHSSGPRFAPPIPSARRSADDEGESLWRRRRADRHTESAEGRWSGQRDSEPHAHSESDADAQERIHRRRSFDAPLRPPRHSQRRQSAKDEVEDDEADLEFPAASAMARGLQPIRRELAQVVTRVQQGAASIKSAAISGWRNLQNKIFPLRKAAM